MLDLLLKFEDTVIFSKEPSLKSRAVQVRLFFFSNLSICVSIFSPDSFSECKFAGFQGLERNRKISSPRGYALNRNWLADICHNLESSASGADVQKVG